MSPALITQAPETTTNHPNGQISYSLSLNFSGFSPEYQPGQYQTLSNAMNPSNAGNRSSGFSSTIENKSDFRFESPPVSRSGSGLTRPRFVKVRKGLSSQNLWSAEIPKSQVDLGYNPFRPISENSIPASSGSEKGSSGSGIFGFGKSSDEAFVFGANTSDSRTSGVVEELENLKIGSEFVTAKDDVFHSSSSARVSSISGKGGENIIDENIMSKLPEDLRKLHIGGPGNVEHPEKVMGMDMRLPEDMRKLNIEDPGHEKQGEKVASGRFNLSGNESMRSGFGSTNSVGGSIGKNMEFELQNELNKKLNIKETGKLDGGSVRYNADDLNKFEFGSRKGGESLAESFASTLPDQIKNLNLKDSLNTSDKENPASQSTKSKSSDFDGRKEILLSTNMEEQKGSGAGETLQSDVGAASSNSYAKDMPTGYFGNLLFRNLDKSVHSESMLHPRMQGKNASRSQVSSDLPKDDVKQSGVTASSSASFASSSSHAQTAVNSFEVPVTNRPQKKEEFIFASEREFSGIPSFEFKTTTTTNLFSGLNENLEFSAKRDFIRDAGMKKRSGKLKRPTKVQLWLGQDFVSRESSYQEIPEASDAYSPMDVSPYQETLADNRCYRENSVTSDDSFSLDNSMGTDSIPKVSIDAIDEDLATAASRMDINEGNATCRETKEENFDNNLSGESTLDESASGAETESFKSATEEVDFISDNIVLETEASSSSNIEGYDNGRTKVGFSSSSEGLDGSNFTFSASSAAQGQSSTLKLPQKKKNWLKVGHDTNNISPNARISYASSSSQFIPFSGASLLLSPGKGQKVDPSSLQRKCRDSSEVDRAQAVGRESDSASAAIIAAQEACEKWRLRGNQAYTAGDLSKAEDCYTQGINCVPRSETSRSCLRALMLCYSNRAATRISLGRMRDALGDCMMAAEIDPSFLRVQVRAANCYLAIGEIEDASRHFRRCLQAGSDVCVDRKIAVEASDGLQKVQKVSECLDHSAEFLQRKRSSDAESALELIAEALKICPYSEKLLEMKAESLFLIRRYEEVIELCEQTLGSAERNCPPGDTHDQSANVDVSSVSKYFYFRLWRCRIAFKSYFHLGRLEDGLALLEKHEERLSATYRNDSKILESSVPLAVTVRELLRHKAAGNEAFQGGKHAEAVERYTAALSCNGESRPFSAVCFCNRAAAYKALGQITDAIADCSLAIALDGNYMKAISRRATLYEMIRDYGQAAHDLQRLVSLFTKQVEDKTNNLGASDRSNSSTTDLRQARLRLSEIEEEARKDIPLDMYLILGVDQSVSTTEIKKAYRKAALRHHPDKAGQFLARSDNGDDRLWKEIAEEVYKDADRLFKMIGEAYAVLSDSTKRAQYDAEEEMRNAQKKRNGSSTSRAQTDTQNYPFERTGSRRQWRDVWRQYGGSTSTWSEATRSSRYS
ncbi:N-terminal acetyltransferase A, auxiliary subunit [Parasponia andersonii]|uniref:N-terminal acetyltransferase A, auxiliary subunit n=1 Tax=Parasponia andersonii TaxID=3476 RepID=A0A2P5CDG0_PARAD|nr:N-terminal acetyltransferase A, auxiliary subunit [Parasponia andersonii]